MTTGDSARLIALRADYLRVLTGAGVDEGLASEMANLLEECRPDHEVSSSPGDVGQLAH